MTREPLRFAMVTTFYPPFNFGGDGIYVQRLAHALSARGHSVDVIHDTDAYRTLAGHEPDSMPEEDGVKVHRLRSSASFLSSFSVHQLGRPTNHRAQLRELLTNRFDVIHYHNVSLVGGPGVWSIGTGIKLHTAHEHWLVCPSHTLWRDNRELCDEKRCLRCVLRHRRPPQLWRATGLLDREAMNVDMFLMLSQSAADNHRRFGFRAPMTVVPSFLPDRAEVPDPDSDSMEQRSPYFLFVGRLEPIKGLHNVIPAFDDALAVDLLIAGTGQQEPELRRIAQGRRNVRFLGRKSMRELHALYRDAIAVITPSQCYEVFPMVVLEAFRVGTPIVARDLGPYPDIVKRTGGGLLFRTELELRSCLHRLLANPSEAAELGCKASLGFSQHWSEDVAMAAYFDVIRKAAEARGMRDVLAKLSPDP